MATKTKEKGVKKAKGKTNYSAVFADEPIDEIVADQKSKRSEGGKFPTYLDLEDGEEVTLRFLEFDPIKFWQHRVWDPKGKRGKGGFRVFSCTRQPDCPLCRSGNKPSFKVAWQVIHVDALDQNGDIKPRVKLFVKGIRFAEYYTKKTLKKDPTKQNVVLERIGSDQNTTYSFAEWGDKGKVDYDEEELVDLEEYFGLDDEKFAEMERLADEAEETEYSGPKKGKRSRLENDEDDDDVPY